MNVASILDAVIDLVPEPRKLDRNSEIVKL